MREQLFFHERANEELNILDHSYCIEFKDETLYVGYAITHKEDMFCKKIGRESAQRKTTALKTIAHEDFISIADIDFGLPMSISMTILDVVECALGILKLPEGIEIKTFANNGKQKVPVKCIYC